MDKRAEKERRQQRKQERKFKQEQRRLERGKDDRRIEEEYMSRMTLQEKARHRAD